MFNQPKKKNNNKTTKIKRKTKQIPCYIDINSRKSAFKLIKATCCSELFLNT